MPLSKLKVLLVAPPRFKLHRGGMEIQIEETIQGLRNCGVEIILFDPWNYQFHEADILHLFGFEGCMLPLVLHARKLGIPVVVSPVFNLFSGTPLLGYIKCILGRFIPAIYVDIRRAANIVNQSNAILAQTLVEQRAIVTGLGGNIERCYIIENGISDRFLQANADFFCKKYGVENYVLHVGAFTRNKNQLGLIRAIKDLDISVVLIGSQGTDESYFEACKNEAGSNVIFVGGLDYDNPLLASAYAGASVFVMPSFSETWGMAIYEAAASGTVIAASKTIPLNDTISRVAERFDPGDPSEIRRAIIKTYGRGRHSIKKPVSVGVSTWSEVCLKIHNVYRQLV